MIDSARQIENLLYTYAERIDLGDLDGLAALFAYGRIEAAIGAPPFVGRDGVRAMFDAATRLYDDGTPRTKHVTTNAIIDVSDDDEVGSSRSYYTVFQQTEALALAPIIAGRYHDTFRRVDGEWCFDVRIMLVDLVGDLSQHLKYQLP